MQVKRDFDLIYREQPDPWQIGAADSDRYNLYFNLIRAHACGKASILDIGCGFGAFLARFQGDYEHLVGVELSKLAIQKGQQKHPFIQFIQGSADQLGQCMPPASCYDTIVYSDVIYYLDETGKHASLQWVAEHLAQDGLAFIAGWCPGGDYMTFDEMKRLVERYLRVEECRYLDSQHAVFLTRKRRNFVSITIDYETWQPIPAGKSINWEKDVFQPTDQLLALCEREQAKLTLFAEMGEYFWLQQNQPEVAAKMEAQWQAAIRQGHDVQLHLHPNWLPELGARAVDGQWYWDWSKAKAADYPGDLMQLIATCKATLEALLRPIDPQYTVTAFRAGAYAAQPFQRLAEALAANGIFCDSSVYAGGVSQERGYDYSMPYANHQPYFANYYDPQLKAPPAEQAIVEIPIFTFAPGQRWFLDNTEGEKFAERLLTYLAQQAATFKSNEDLRRLQEFKRLWRKVYLRLAPLQGQFKRFVPKALLYYLTEYGPEHLVEHHYYVMIGHTKADLHWSGIATNLRQLKQQGFEFITLSDMAHKAKAELLANQMARSKTQEAEYQVQREYNAVLGDARNEQQSYYLQQMIPWDRKNVLDLGTGAGYWASRIASLYPWMNIVGIDYGFDFIAKAQRQYSSPRTLFQVADFVDLPFADGFFDCIYADNTLEHAYDVDSTLREAYRVLQWNGVLVAAIPGDAHNSERICDNHTWKTAPHEVKLRLQRAGFVNIEITEIDTLRQLGMSPYPPAQDQMMYIRAWKRPQETLKLARAIEAMYWVYQTLSPEKSSTSGDPVEILKGGYAYCWGSVVVLGKLLQREGFDVRWVTMLARNHPKGRGEEQTDSHEVLQVTAEGKTVILDAMANTCIPYAIAELVRQPALAKAKAEPDERYLARGYKLYDTDFWYQRVYQYAARPDIRGKFNWIKV